MQVQKIFSTSRFLESAREFLELREAESNLLFGILERQIRESLGDYPLMTKVNDGKKTVFVSVLVGDTLFISDGPATAIEIAAKAVAEEKIELRAIAGPSTSCDAFVDWWQRDTQRRCVLTVNDILYKLTDVIKLENAVGNLRLMTPDDVEIVARRQIGFANEAMTQELGLGESIERANIRVMAGETYIWEVSSEAVSMAALARPHRQWYCY